MEDEVKVKKASLLEKLTVFFFFVVPLIVVILVRRIQNWTVKHLNQLITFNLVLVLILAVMLLVLRIWLSHVRGW